MCVDLPCGQTYIWFVFLVLAIDHHIGLDLINTEAVHRSGTCTHTQTHILSLILNFDLQKEQEVQRDYDEYARHSKCVRYTMAYLLDYATY